MGGGALEFIPAVTGERREQRIPTTAWNDIFYCSWKEGAAEWFPPEINKCTSLFLRRKLLASMLSECVPVHVQMLADSRPTIEI